MPELELLRKIEFDNPGSTTLANANQKLLENPNLDVVVMRGLWGFLKPIIEYMKTDGRYTPDYIKLRRDAGITAADKLVTEWWQEHGYSNYHLTQGGTITLLPIYQSAGLISCTHIDDLSPHHGPTTLSVARSGVAMFHAERPQEPMFVTGTRQYSSQKYTLWAEQYLRPKQLPDGQYDTPDHDRLKIRSTVIQQPGDGVLFANHPTPSFHAITVLEPGQSTVRDARIFDYLIG